LKQNGLNQWTTDRLKLFFRHLYNNNIDKKKYGNGKKFMDGLEEKFTRCPKCRSYSIASTPPKIYNSFFSRFTKSYNHYHCRNCGHNFKQIQNEENHFFVHREGTKKSKAFRILSFSISGCVLAMVLFITLRPADNRSVDHTESNSTTGSSTPSSGGHQQETRTEQTKEAQTPFIEQEKPEESMEEVHVTDTTVPGDTSLEQLQHQSDDTAEAGFDGTVDLAGENRFGVNWVIDRTGLVITRLSEGPLQNAGLKIGDTITHLNNVAIQSDSALMAYKEQLLRGTATDGILLVVRDNQIKRYKILNSAKDKKKNDISNSVLLFPAAPLKIRASSPEAESINYRWAYNKKSITITRLENQKFYLSGDADNLSPWAADNILTISGNDISGLSAPVLPETTVISETHCRDSIEITDYFPSQKTVEVRFALVDLGIRWGNTNIYLVIR